MKTFKYCLSVIALFLCIACDEAEITQTLNDITNADPYANMVLIPAGEVTLGAPAGEVLEVFFQKNIVRRQETVFVDGFYIDTHEVTKDEFFAFLDATGYESTAGWNYDIADQNPPIYVNYHEALAYAEWAGKRLPTDAEWEKAARGGLVGQRYPWGNEPPTDAHARFQGEKYRLDVVNGAVPSGSYPPNAYGLFDMTGNVAEWCYTPDLGLNKSAINRGGSWAANLWTSRVYVRQWTPTSIDKGTIGFRCVKDVER